MQQLNNISLIIIYIQRQLKLELKTEKISRNFSSTGCIFQDLRVRASIQPIYRGVKTPTKLGLIDLGVYQILSYFLLDLEGYAVAYSRCLSQGNNDFYDVEIKTSETETKTICIMK